MPEDLLYALADVDLSPLPCAGDAGDATVGAALAREFAARNRSRPGVRGRRLRLPFGRSVSLVPAVICATVATAAATGIVHFSHATVVARAQVIELRMAQLATASPTAVFETNPEPHALSPAETVIPSTVRLAATAHVPGVGSVKYWTANTTHGGICRGLRAPNGAWAAMGEHGARADGQTVGGTVPGCLLTEGRAVNDAWALFPTDHDRGAWIACYGMIDPATGAVTVTDPAAGASAPVLPGGYFILVSRMQDNVAGCNFHFLTADGAEIAGETSP